MNKQEELLSYRNGITLEHKIEQLWYKDPDPYTIMFWNPEAAHEEFSGINNSSFYPPQTKTKWLRSVSQTKRLVKKCLAEALLSKSEYVRTYAELLINKKS